jgi:hypothetical protein
MDVSYDVGENVLVVRMTNQARVSSLTITADADPDFLRRFAGHLENGHDSVSDPAFGGPGN